MNSKRDGAATGRAALEPEKQERNADAAVREANETPSATLNQGWRQLSTPWYSLRKDTQATRLLLFAPQMMLRYTCYWLGLSLLTVLVGAWLREQLPWFDNLLNAVFGQEQSQFAYVKLGFTIMSLYGQFYLGCLMYKKWKAHVYKRDLTNHSGVRFFWDEASRKALENEIADPQKYATVWQQKQGTFFTKGEGWKPLPVGTELDILHRGYNTVGMSVAAFVWKELTVGMIYPFTALKRILLNRCGFPAGARIATRREMYLGVQNTAFGTFVSPDTGNIVVRNLELPYAQNSVKHFEKFEIHLNHDTKEVEGVTLEYFPPGSQTTVIDRYGFTDGLNTPVLPPMDESQLTATEKQARAERIAQEQLQQCALLCLTVLSLYSHSAIHWWANGVALINQKIWPAAEKSVNITQWMNSQAAFFAWLFFGTSQDVFGKSLAHNSANGLPLHHDKPAFYTMAVTSNMHRMAAIVRRKLLVLLEQQKMVRDALEILPEECDPVVRVMKKPLSTITPKEVDCLVAATVMHGADHYYCAKHFPLFGHGNCLSLQTDISGLIQSLIKPLRYYFIRLLVREQLSSADLHAIQSPESRAAGKAYHAKWIELTTYQQQIWTAPDAETRQQLRGQIEQLSAELHELDQADIRQLLKDGRTDPVSYIIYRECRAVDEDFADNALCVGCAA